MYKLCMYIHMCVCIYIIVYVCVCVCTSGALYKFFFFLALKCSQHILNIIAALCQYDSRALEHYFSF